jgi:tetratricopeptide (TPR) repeat protein
MRRLMIFCFLALASVGATGPSAEQAFGLGMQALAKSEWERALDLLEQALGADADSVRYASEYRQAILRYAQTVHPKEGRVEDFERSLKFFDHLVARNPGAANAYLNYGFAYVDKIPAAGAITQVILANTALSHFTKSLELRPSWIGYYTRGVSYLFWPKIFGRAKLGVADLERALQLQKAGPRRPYHVRTWIALGNGYWKMDDLEKARATWGQGLKEFPGDAVLEGCLAQQGDALKTLIEDALDPGKRVDTNLKDLWTNP